MNGRWAVQDTTKMNTGIETYPTPVKLAEAAAQRFSHLAHESMDRHGRFCVALSGGSTPQALYQDLAASPDCHAIDWRHIHVFWGDERCVPPDHDHSNYGMARNSLLNRVPIPPHQIYRIRGEDAPISAAAAYEADLRACFSEDEPRFDLIWLGMGNDGHTASLFPDTPAVTEAIRVKSKRLVVANFVEVEKSWRITFTPRLINAAANVIFLVAGVEKAEILKQVITGPYEPLRLPSQLVRPENGRLTWMLDTEAAHLLDECTQPKQAG